MITKLFARLAPLATPQLIRLAFVTLALISMVALPGTTYAYPIGGGSGG